MADGIAQQIVEMEKEQLRELRRRALAMRRTTRYVEDLERRGFPTGYREGYARDLRAARLQRARLVAWKRRLVAEAKTAARAAA